MIRKSQVCNVMFAACFATMFGGQVLPVAAQTAGSVKAKPAAATEGLGMKPSELVSAVEQEWARNQIAAKVRYFNRPLRTVMSIAQILEEPKTGAPVLVGTMSGPDTDSQVYWLVAMTGRPVKQAKEEAAKLSVGDLIGFTGVLTEREVLSKQNLHVTGSIIGGFGSVRSGTTVVNTPVYTFHNATITVLKTVAEKARDTAAAQVLVDRMNTRDGVAAAKQIIANVGDGVSTELVGGLIESVIYSALYTRTNNPELGAVLSYLVDQMTRTSGYPRSAVLGTTAQLMVFAGIDRSRYTQWELEYGEPKADAFRHTMKALLYQSDFPASYFASENVMKTISRWAGLRKDRELDLVEVILDHPKIGEAGLKAVAPQFERAINGPFGGGDARGTALVDRFKKVITAQ